MGFDNLKGVCLVCGATQGIGLEIARLLSQLNSIKRVFVTYRSKSNLSEISKLASLSGGKVELLKIDLDQESSYSEIVGLINGTFGKLDLFINCIGVLEDDVSQVERSVEQFSAASMLNLVRINTLPTLLFAKHLKPLLKKSKRPIFASLSAKVGSISENGRGGWYGYRASKAALNMSIKSFSVELQRSNPDALVLALHPGTTKTRMTDNFIASAAKQYKIHEASETAQNLLKVLNGTPVGEGSGKFISWDGSEIPW